MKITHDIVADLLPAYLSGEASADTRALIDELSAADPAVSRLVHAAREGKPAPWAGDTALPPDLERAAVMRTRRVLRRRSWTLALALFFTALPFAFGFNGDGLTFLMFRDEPGSRLLWLSAIYLWFDYVRQNRRLRVGV